MRRSINKAGSVLGVAIIVVISGMATLTSCHKWGDNESSNEIILTLDERFDAVVDTKATPVTSIPSTLYWGGTTGGNAAGSAAESAKWSCESKSVSSSKINTGRYQTYSPTTYNYYVANQPFTVGSSTTMTVANNSVDVIVGRTAETSSTTPSVVLNHIFARTGSLSFSVPSGYTQSNVTWKIQSKGAVTGTSGTYNLTTGAWTASSASLSQQTFTSSSNLWLIPGTYTITISFRLTKGDFVKDYTQSQDVNLAVGKVNNISATTTTDEAVQVTFGVSLSAWTSQAHNLTAADFEPVPPPYFSVGASTKVQFAPGNLQAVIGTGISDYRATASSWKFAAHQYDFIGNAEGNTSFAVGTTVDLFCWVGESANYDSYGLCTSTSSGYYGNIASEALKTDWGSIPDVVSSLGTGWHTLTSTEWNYLFTERTNASSLYGRCQITTASGTVTGMLILPDNWDKPSNCTVTPGTGVYNRVTYSATASSGTTNAWCDMEAAGAVFLPAAGFRRGVSVDDVGSYGEYWSSLASTNAKAYYLSFFSNYLYPQDNSWRYNGFSVRLVRSAN